MTNMFMELNTLKNRKYYEKLFEHYPDVVTLKDLRTMLGGVAESTVRRLMQENRIKHYYIRETYMIPKLWVIDYVLGKHYDQYKKKLRVQV